MTPLDDDREQQLADLLADYEAQMAGGGFDTPQGEIRSAVDTLEESHRLQSAKACLLRLERIWPHGKPLDDELPRAIDRFQVISELGRGGFGIVYLARDAKMGRLVALKVQRPETLLSASLRQRFVREARAAARLSHQHIAGVYEVGEAGVRVWMASEYVAGGSLSAWLRDNQGPVAPKAAARLVADLADALTCAHRLGVLHRDLKPSNVLLQRIAANAQAAGADDATRSSTVNDPVTRVDDLSTYAPKLIDFGLARLDEGTRHETRTGALIGTPPYMAPEQAAGQTRQFGPATDVYGLGTILYELVTGRAPFRGENDVQTLRQVLDDDPPHPRKLRAELPADLAAITLKCLEKQPAARYASTAELAADLQRFLSDNPTIARPLSIPQRVAKWSRRRPAAAALIAVSVLAAMTFAAVNAVYIRQLRHSTEAAEALRKTAEASATAATEQEDLAQRYLYASRMPLAYELLSQGDGIRAAQLLEYYAPPSRQAHRRGFEWYHLRRRLHAEEFALKGHSGQVYGVAYSPDGRVVASSGQDGLIKLWDPSSGRELNSFTAHKACANSVAYSPDGQLLASIGCDHMVKLWNAHTLEPIATLEGHPGEVHSLGFSPDGKLLATGGHQGVLLVWDLATQEILADYKVRGANVDYLLWVGDRKLMFPDCTVWEDARQLIWDVDSDEMQFIRHSASAVTTSRDRRRVVVGDHASIHTLPELSDITAGISGNGQRISTLALTPSEKHLVAGYFDGNIRIWSWPSLVCREVWSVFGARPQTIAFSPDGQQMASANWDGTVKLWPSVLETSPKIETTLATIVGGLGHFRIATSDDMRYFAAPTHFDAVTVFDIASGKELATLPVSELPSAIRFDRQNPEVLFVLLPDRGTLMKCHWRTGQFDEHAMIKPLAYEPHYISPGAQQLFVSRDAPTNKYLMVDSASDSAWFQRPRSAFLRNFASSNSGNVVAISQRIGPAKSLTDTTDILDLQRRTVLLSDIGDIVNAVSDDGQLFVGGDGTSAVSVRAIADRSEVCHISLDATLTSVALTPDNKTLAAADATGAISLWNISTGHLVGRLLPEAPEHAIVRLWFDAQGQQLVALGIRQPPEPSRDRNVCGLQLFVFSGSDEP